MYTGAYFERLRLKKFIICPEYYQLDLSLSN
jgi:hypothetical protein